MNPIEVHWSLQAGYPILASLQLLPLLGAALLLALREPNHLMPFALAVAVLEFGLALDLYRHFDPLLPALQLAEWRNLPGPLDYHAGVDDVRLMIILLTTVFCMLLVLYLRLQGQRWARRRLSGLFALEAMLMFLVVSLSLM